MYKTLLFFFLFSCLTAHSQNFGQRVFFSEAIGENIKKYTQKSQKAYADKDFEYAETLFDSLINHVINGSYLDNFKVKKASGKQIEFYDFEKPVFLMTYASWCTPGVGEIPALNDVAEKYSDDIDFVMLFWDCQKNVKKVAGQYSKKINILYVDEKENHSGHLVEIMKHSLGFPTSFFVDADRKIVDVRRGALHPYNEAYEISFELNYNAFFNGISLLKNFQLKPEESMVSKKEP